MRNAVTKLMIDVRSKLTRKMEEYDAGRGRMDSHNAAILNVFLTNTELWESSENVPTFFNDCGIVCGIDERYSGYLYKNVWYWVTGNFTADQKKLLILESADKERVLFERLHAKFSSPAAKDAAKPRLRIPEEVRVAVWRRDGGMCSTPGCGSKENLEYDHIIPVSKGGSNTVRNIELLCERCNRAKGNRIEEVPFKLE